MKKLFFITILIFVFSLALPAFSFAQGAIVPNDDGHTAREEAEGKAIWEKLQVKELTCKDLSDDNFETLGEYFMGQMMGNSHEAMNNMMVGMMGKKGEKQMHVVMGKRFSGCDWGFDGTKGGGNSMMGNFGSNPMGWFGFGWIFMILFWGLVILAVVALIKWIANQDKNQTQSKSAVDILKERYAKGEITKKEFEEMKKVIN